MSSIDYVKAMEAYKYLLNPKAIEESTRLQAMQRFIADPEPQIIKSKPYLDVKLLLLIESGL